MFFYNDEGIEIGVIGVDLSIWKSLDREYAAKAEQTRPIIEALGPPIFSKLSYSRRKIDLAKVTDKLKHDLLITNDRNTIPDTSILQMSIVLNGKLSLVNRSPFGAYLRVVAYLDTPSLAPIIRNRLLNRQNQNDLSLTTMSTYLKQGDTSTICFDQELQGHGHLLRRSALHFLVQYENQSHALFESYFWAKYFTKQAPGVRLGLTSKNGNEDITLTPDDNPPDSVFTIDDFKSILYNYTRAEAESLHTKFKDIYTSPLP